MIRAVFHPSFILTCALLGCSNVSNKHIFTAPASTPPSIQEATASIHWHVVNHQPRLLTIKRDGLQPSEISISVITGVPVRLTLLLATLYEQRLRQLGYSVDKELLPGAFRLGIHHLQNAQIANSAQAIHTILSTPMDVNSPEFKQAEDSIQTIQVHVAPRTLAEQSDPCLPTWSLTKESSASDAIQLDTWQRDVFGRNRIGLSIVGPSVDLTAFVHAYNELPAMPLGTEIPLQQPQEHTVSVLSAPQASHPTELTFQVFTKDPFLSVSAQSIGLIQAQLHSLYPAWNVRRFHSNVLSTGGCVSIHLETTKATTPPTVRTTANLVREQILRAISEQTAAQTIATTLTNNTSNESMAAIGSWWAFATTSPLPTVTQTTLILPKKTSVSGYREALISQTAPFEPEVLSPLLDGTTQEISILVANPCGQQLDTAWFRGIATLATYRAAISAQRLSPTIQVQPYVSHGNTGLLLTRPLHSNESAQTETLALIESASRAFFATPLVHSDFENAQLALIKDIHLLQPSANESFLKRLSGDNMTQLFPLGLPMDIERMTSEDVLAAWQQIVSGPLRIALSSPISPNRQDIARVFKRWRPPYASSACGSFTNATQSSTIPQAPEPSSWIGFMFLTDTSNDYSFALVTNYLIQQIATRIIEQEPFLHKVVLDMKWLEGSDRAAIAIQVHGDTVHTQNFIRTLQQKTTHLVQSGITETAFTEAFNLAQSHRFKMLSSAQSRLIYYFHHKAFPNKLIVDMEDFSRWMKQNLSDMVIDSK